MFHYSQCGILALHFQYNVWNASLSLRTFKKKTRGNENFMAFEQYFPYLFVSKQQLRRMLLLYVQEILPPVELLLVSSQKSIAHLLPTYTYTFQHPIPTRILPFDCARKNSHPIEVQFHGKWHAEIAWQLLNSVSCSKIVKNRNGSVRPPPTFN